MVQLRPKILGARLRHVPSPSKMRNPGIALCNAHKAASSAGLVKSSATLAVSNAVRWPATRGVHASSSCRQSSSSSPRTTADDRRQRAQRASYLFAGAALGVAGVLSSRIFTETQEATTNSDRDHTMHARTLHCEPAPPRTEPDIAHLDPDVLEDPSVSMRTRMETYVKLLQHRIVRQLGAEEGAKTFLVDSWLRKEGGEGISCVLQDGETFEKAGVNISIVHGTLPPRAIAQMTADHAGLLDRVGYKLGLEKDQTSDVKGLPFYATGLSLVVHPKNPLAPTVHFNYRYFELTHPPKLADGSDNPRYDPAEPNKPAAWWFGGGSDLTPMQLFESDATHFHNTIKEAADQHDRHFYPVWKAWCDRYFWIPHRGEARGVGGIFFDDLTVEDGAAQSSPEPVPLSPGSVKASGVRGPNDPHPPPASLPSQSALPHTRESLFATVRALGDAFLPAYLPLLQVRKRMKYTSEDEAWQAVRRGRYVEFNLVYDRGTKFGLQTPGARIESILMSLPLRASWVYSHPVSSKDRPTEEQRRDLEKKAAGPEFDQLRMMQVLRTPRDWATTM